MSVKFSITTDAFKKALHIVSLALEDKNETIGTHALFRIKSNSLSLFATDKDRIAYTECPLHECGEDEIEFTASPKKLQALIASSGEDIISMEYEEEEKTLKVFASENKGSYVSLASFSAEKFHYFDADLEKMQSVATVDAGILLFGIKFIQGFLPTDDRKKSLSSMYISEGVFYGSNGFDKVAAFQNEDLKSFEDLSIRRIVLPKIITFIDRSSVINIELKTTSKFIAVYSPDGQSCFGFLKTTQPLPKFPITLDRPDTDFSTFDRSLFIKKIDRLSIASGKDIGIQATLGKASLSLKTIDDRKSEEEIDISITKGKSTPEEKDFIFQYEKLKPVLSQFGAPDIDLYLGENRGFLFSEGDIEISQEGDTENKSVLKKFKQVAVVGLGRIA